jgi:hypothetical protein
VDNTTQGEFRKREVGQCRRPLACRWLLAAAALALAGCDWIGLGWGAAMYPTTADGMPANVVAAGGFAYATGGSDGIEIIDLAAPSMRRVVAPARGTTVDDLAVADGLLFALDARPPGSVAVYSLADPARPVLVQAPVIADVGPFSGVSAAGGLVIVSGGTSRLSLRRYTANGALSAALETLDLGRGQPDVLMAPDGRIAYVSVHDSGPHFSLAVLALEPDPLSARVVGKFPLQTYGFTPGGAKPANFPIEMAQSGDDLLIASAAGLQVVRISDPSRPQLIATLEPKALPVNVDASGSLVAVVGSKPVSELTLVDLANPAAPRTLRTIRLPERSLATGVALAGSHAVVAAHAAGTLLFDLDDLTHSGDNDAHP